MLACTIQGHTLPGPMWSRIAVRSSGAMACGWHCPRDPVPPATCTRPAARPPTSRPRAAKANARQHQRNVLDGCEAGGYCGEVRVGPFGGGGARRLVGAARARRLLARPLALRAGAVCGVRQGCNWGCWLPKPRSRDRKLAAEQAPCLRIGALPMAASIPNCNSRSGASSGTAPCASSSPPMTPVWRYLRTILITEIQGTIDLGGR